MKRVLVTGGSGFIGQKLTSELALRGDQVTVLTRNASRASRSLPQGVRVASWTPEKEGPWFEELEVVDVVVHLAGESVAQRWSEEKKKSIERSRVESTRLLATAIGRAKKKPRAFICASATGIYGSQRPQTEELDESSEPGSGFLADVVKHWEAAARAVEEHGVRSAQVRIGVVLGEGGGALEKMLLPFKFFAGGPIGKGNQVISWVHRDDVAGIFLLAIDDDALHGPINAVAPAPATSNELAQAIGSVLNRPSWFRTPAALINMAMGEAAEIVTTGQRVMPKRAVELGYAFHYTRLTPALESILAP